jgi:hypothetical protein
LESRLLVWTWQSTPPPLPSLKLSERLGRVDCALAAGAKTVAAIHVADNKIPGARTDAPLLPSMHGSRSSAFPATEFLRPRTN